MAAGHIKEDAKKILRKASGGDLLQEEVDTLFFFLNTYVDIEKCPATTGELRDLQVCDALMLRIFESLCRQYGLSYWLDFGTLLGAARHKGFIPWDDDLDVSMRRDDWNKAAELIPPILRSAGFYARVISESWFGFGYRRDSTGLWMDVFCYECYKDEGDESLTRLHSVIDEQLAFSQKHKTFSAAPGITLDEMKANRLKTAYPEKSDRSGHSHLFLSPEIQDKHSHNVFDYEDIFPLEELEFEDACFPVPRKWDKVLTKTYGDWHLFPKTGILHHGIKGTSVKDVAGQTHTDMGQVKAELQSILASLH